MSKNKSLKRLVAGILALTLVLGNATANLGAGWLFDSSETSISASAEDSGYTFVPPDGQVGTSCTLNSTDGIVSLTANYLYKMSGGTGSPAFDVNDSGHNVTISSTSGTIDSVIVSVYSNVDNGLNASAGTKNQNEHTYTFSNVNASSLVLTGGHFSVVSDEIAQKVAQACKVPD